MNIYVRTVAWFQVFQSNISNFWKDLLIGLMVPKRVMFVSTSHRTGLNTRSFFIVGVLGKKAWSRVEPRTLLDYAFHRLTRCNVSQMTQLDLDSLDVTWVGPVCLLKAWTRLEGLVLCCANNAVCSLESGPAEDGSHFATCYIDLCLWAPSGMDARQGHETGANSPDRGNLRLVLMMGYSALPKSL